MRIDTEVYFRPDESGREPGRIRADLYRQCRAALAHSITDCAFVPVRSMQLLAVITRNEVVFVDSLNYAVRNGRGGHMIMLAWDLGHGGEREYLDAPVPIEIILFHTSSADLHARLMSEFGPALAKLADRERRDQAQAGIKAEIIPLDHD